MHMCYVFGTRVHNGTLTLILQPLPSLCTQPPRRPPAHAVLAPRPPAAAAVAGKRVPQLPSPPSLSLYLSFSRLEPRPRLHGLHRRGPVPRQPPPPTAAVAVRRRCRCGRPGHKLPAWTEPRSSLSPQRLRASPPPTVGRATLPSTSGVVGAVPRRPCSLWCRPNSPQPPRPGAGCAWAISASARRRCSSPAAPPSDDLLQPPARHPTVPTRRRPPPGSPAAAQTSCGLGPSLLGFRASPPPIVACAASPSTPGVVPNRPRPAPAAASPPATVGRHRAARELAAPYAAAAPPAALRRLAWSAPEPRHLVHPSPAGPPAGIPPAANPSSPLTVRLTFFCISCVGVE
ncbi:vegetative cell wall protein gp1-like [Ananas comosus]|uniref:Vegetative cell wall protein gp1-like n=1 Tax=Ananas comosus TaxID=4615 RepID=A0A6P5GB82_ANACO|nr:vegetative cell wall protein gp1-like [Ananas comosus]